MEIRSITDAEVPPWRLSLIHTFGGDPAGDPEGDERFLALVDRSRAFGAFDRGAVVGTAAGFDFSLSIPGGSIPMSGLTMVSVRPTHRRRGVLRDLMAAHLEAARRHGDPISGLWASEATIYGRFGYGIAAEGEDLELATAGAVVAEGRELDEVEMIPDAVAAELLPRVFEQVYGSRPGMFTRSPAWWRYRRMVDRPENRGGASPRKHVVARRGDTVTGHIAYRQKLGWSSGVPSGQLGIDELMAVDPRAEATLWRFIASVDLYPKVGYWNAPVDSLLPFLLDNPRRVTRRRTETLWLRIEDVAAALEARRYAGDGTLRFAIDAEVYQLTVAAGVGRCEPTGAAPELRLDRPSLGSIYLGGFRPSLLARAGRISGDAAALATADALFGWPVAPWCPEIF